MLVYISVGCFLLFQHVSCIGRTEFVNGLQFDELSRSRLLKILSTFEHYFKNRLPPHKSVVFAADFASNKYTKPFVFPENYNRKPILDLIKS